MWKGEAEPLCNENRCDFVLWKSVGTNWGCDFFLPLSQRLHLTQRCLWLTWFSIIITVYILYMRFCCAGPTPHHIIHCLCNDHRTVFTCYNCAIKFPKPHKGHVKCSDLVTDTFTFLFFKTNIPNFPFWMLWIGVVFEDRSNWNNDGTFMENPSHGVAAWVEGIAGSMIWTGQSVERWIMLKWNNWMPQGALSLSVESPCLNRGKVVVALWL